MKLISAKYHNFMGFGEEQNLLEFDKVFSDGETLLMVGIRDGNPKHSNGAGKSTIIEGICYGFFGKLPRIVAQHPDNKGNVAKQIIRTDTNNEMISGESYVELRFEGADGRIWSLKRGRKVNSKKTNHSRILELECVTKEGEKYSGADAEEEIESILQFSFESLVNSCLFAQRDSGKFLSGSDSAKKDLFMELVGTQIVDRMLANVRRRKSVINKERTQVDAKIEVLKDRLHASSTDDPNARRKQLENEIESNSLGVNKINEEIEELSKNLSQDKYETLNEKRHSLQLETGHIETERDKEISPLKKDLDDAIAKAGHGRDQQKEIEQQKQKLQSEYNELEAKITTDEKLIEMEKTIEEAKRDALEHEKKLKELNQKYSELTSQVVEVNTNIKTAENTASSIQNFLETGDPGSPCPTCGSKEWTKKAAQSEISNQEKHLVELRSKYDQLTEEIQKIKNDIEKIEINLQTARKSVARETEFVRIKSESDNAKSRCEQIKKEAKIIKQKSLENEEMIEKNQDSASVIQNKIEDIKKKYENRLSDKHTEIEKVKKQVAEVLAENKRCQEQIENCRASLNNARKIIEDNKRKLAVLNEKAESIRKDNEELIKTTKELAVFDKNLKRILLLDDVMSKDGFKSQVAERFVPHMNRYANEFLSLLSPDLSLDISMDGSDIKVVVKGTNSSDYDMCSGGEQEVIRLAVNIANSMIAIGGNSDLPGIILLDEIFGSLDPMVCENVFTLLERLNEYFPRIVVITHDLALQNFFAKRLVIAKEGKICRIDGLQEVA